TCLSVVLQWNGSGKAHCQVRRCEDNAIWVEDRLVRLPPIIEGGPACKTNTYGPSDTPDPAIEMPIPCRIRIYSYRHENFELRDSVRQQKPGNQNGRRRQIKLFVPYFPTCGANLKSAAFGVIKNGSEYAWRVEVGVTIPVDRTVHSHQCNGPHIANDSVVFDR